MGVVFLCAGLANTASIVYFRSDSYSGGQDKLNEQMRVAPGLGRDSHGVVLARGFAHPRP